MKDWQRSPEPPGIMGPTAAYDRIEAKFGPPETSTDDSLPASAGQSGKHARFSLTSMCKKVILRNLNAVQDLGDMPFRIAKDILEQCAVPQLMVLEEASPHLKLETESIWKRNCLRDFLDVRRSYEQGEHRKETSSWRRLYFRKKGEIESQKAEAAQRIKDRYASHRAEKDAKKLVVSDKILTKTKARGRAGRATPFAGAPAMTKGQSLLNKARSGSAAQARLITPARSATAGPNALGKSRMVANMLQPKTSAPRPMVAPKRITGAAQGLRDAAAWNQLGGTTTTIANAKSSSHSPSPDVRRHSSGPSINFFAPTSATARGTKRAHPASPTVTTSKTVRTSCSARK